MGGNFICIAGGKPYMGDALDITRKGAIPRLIQDVSEMVTMLNNEYEIKFGYQLWPLLDSQLPSRIIFAGSTRHIFEEPEEELVNRMPEVSDLDIYIPKPNRRGDALSLLFEELANAGTRLGAFSVMCYKKHEVKRKPSVPGETLAVDRGTNAIFKYSTESGEDAYIQIDFMPTSLPTGEEAPEQRKKMELWVKLSHSSDWGDRTLGVKGVFHKYLIQSMFSVLTRLPGRILTAGSLKVTPKRSKAGYEIKIAQPKVSSASEEEMRMSSFSVEKAVARKRLTAMSAVIDGIVSGLPGDLPAADVEAIKGKMLAAIDQMITQDPSLKGADLYKKTSDISSESDEDARDYETDVYEIFNMLFGFIPDDENIKNLYSFMGLISLIRAHILTTKGEQTCREIFEDFVDRLFGSAAQEIDTQSGINDKKKKDLAISTIRQIPELGNLLSSKKEIENMRRDYYGSTDSAESAESSPDEYFAGFNTRMGSRQSTAQRRKASLEETSLRLFVRGLLRA